LCKYPIKSPGAGPRWANACRCGPAWPTDGGQGWSGARPGARRVRQSVPVSPPRCGRCVARRRSFGSLAGLPDAFKKKNGPKCSPILCLSKLMH
jgi:hypothetical protein